MKRKIFTLIVSLMLTMTGFSQLEVREDSFKEVPGFVNINPDKQTDDNDKPYAVLKIKTENINAKQRRQLDFQGDARTFIECEYKVGEVWLYISYYASFIKITHPDLSSTEFWFPYDMKPKCGYELTLVNKSIDGEDILNRLERLEKASTNNEVDNRTNNAVSLFETKGLIKKRGGDYFLGTEKLSKQDYRDLMEDCPEAWTKYKKGKTWTIIGFIPASFGAVLLGIGVTQSLGHNEGADIPIVEGAVLGLLSIPEFIVGKNKKREAYKEYNKHCAKPATLSMGITSNGGIGFTLNF